jgi:hypothetical protein
LEALRVGALGKPRKPLASHSRGPHERPSITDCSAHIPANQFSKGWLRIIGSLYRRLMNNYFTVFDRSVDKELEVVSFAEIK